MIVTFSPVVIAVGPLAVRWFGLLALVGLGVASLLSLRELDRIGRARKVALDALAWGLPVGLLSGRLVHVLGWWEYYFTHASEIWQLNIDGLSLWGGLLGGFAIGFARLRQDPLRRRRILDAIAPYAALGIAIGRVGEFLEGQGQGLPSTLPWATLYTNSLSAAPDFGVPRHPAQLYDALLALIVAGVLLKVPRRWPPGARLASFFVLYGAGRIALGTVRLDAAFLFGLQIEQLLALGAVVYGMVFGLRPLLSHQRASPAASASSSANTRRSTEDPMAA